LRLLVYTMLFPNALQPHHGVFVKERLLAFRERYGADIAVVAPVPWRPGPDGRLARELPREEVLDGLRVVHPRFMSLPGFDRVRAPLMASGTRACLVEEARRHQPSVLDVHYAWPDGAAAVRLRPAVENALRRRVPLVITARGTDLNLSPLVPAVRRQIQAALGRADHVICVAEALRKVALELGVPPGRATTLRNGVDVRRFTPGDRAAARAATALPPGDRVLLCIGHLIERKGQRLLLEAYAKLWAPGGGSRFGPPGPLLALVGAGEDEERLRERARALGIETRVHFAGVVPPTRLVPWYRAADALVLPSLREGWPNVVLEALACGTPVLATAVWGTPEILDGCAAGLLVPPTVEGLVAGLQQLPELDASAARPWAERHTWDATLSGMAAIFEQVCRA
jgi:glycosyltransferase involved in cell wall biosynthesis